MRRLVLLSSILLTVASSAGATITTYKDSEFTRPATEFGDGDKVYFTVTESGITGGTRTVTITSNGSSLQSVTVSAYDHGLYYDKTADDGIFSGMFLVTTKLTIDPVNIESSEYPEGLCYKIVPNIHVDKDAAARIEADFDGNGSSQTASVKLLTLFNVEARAIADTSAVIFWNTGDSGYSRVEYGLTASYGSAAVKETPVKDLALSHYVTLTGLSPGTVYHYKVSSVDTYGNSHVSEDRTFTTRTGAEVEAAIRAARKDGGLPKTYYVKTDGSDSNDGLSIEKAWQHPSYAASKADAGDTIFLMGGTWNDEHLVFASSGIAIAPITLTTYGNGMSVLDGGDKTGYGLRFPGRSYINVSGIHLTNYYYGMAFEASVRDMHFSNYIIENTQSYGVEFVGPGPFSDISFSDFEMSGTGGYALSYGQGFNYSNIEIRDFYIHDTLSCGIYWRYGERVHVNDGKLYNTGSDPVCFSLSMYNSIMENIIVDHAGFHGVAVHDYTLGNNPCFNNIIRNCDISYANHNHIDLHSGAFNTLVENNTLHEESAFCTGIYFHNRGAGLIARNNHIYHVSRGFSGGGFAQYPLSDTLIYSNTVHDCFVHNFDMGADNQIIRDNILYNDPIGGEVCLVGSNILIENNDIDENRTYRTDVGTENILRDPKDSVYYMKSAYGGTFALEYTDNTVYTVQRAFASGDNTVTPSIYTPQKSYSIISSTSSGYVTARITTYPITARPEASTGTVTVSTFNVTLPIGRYHAVFQASVADNVSAMDFTVKSLVPWAWYEVQRDSIAFVTRQLDASGAISFRNAAWTGTHRFGIKHIPDTVSPVISNVTVSGVTGTSIRVTWTTNEPADSRIEYGKTIEYGSRTGTEATPVLVHSLEITGLLPGRYHFRVISRDPSGNEAVSGDYSAVTTGGDQALVIPNPYIKGKSLGSRVAFANLPAGAVLRIYALSGEVVTTILHNAACGEQNEEWDVSGVAGGVYFYTITAGGTTTKGKLAIIK